MIHDRARETAIERGWYARFNGMYWEAADATTGLPDLNRATAWIATGQDLGPGADHRAPRNLTREADA